MVFILASYEDYNSMTGQQKIADVVYVGKPQCYEQCLSQSACDIRNLSRLSTDARSRPPRGLCKDCFMCAYIIKMFDSQRVDGDIG